MENMIDKMEWVFAIIGGFLGWFLGGFDGFLYALIAFVVLDYCTGILAAGVHKKLSSKIGFNGIAKKYVSLFLLVWLTSLTCTL